MCTLLQQTYVHNAPNSYICVRPEAEQPTQHLDLVVKLRIDSSGGNRKVRISDGLAFLSSYEIELT